METGFSGIRFSASVALRKRSSRPLWETFHESTIHA